MVAHSFSMEKENFSSPVPSIIHEAPLMYVTSFSSDIISICIVNDKIIFVRIYFQMWPDILDKARRGGLNLIQTYVFWNGHEPEKDKVCKKKS